MALSVVRDKYKNTCKERFGVDNVSKVDAVKKKKEDTFFKHYGSKYFTQSPEIKEHIKQTFLERYGVTAPAKNHEIFCKTQKRYEYNGVQFHSSWEIFVYFYLKDHCIDFEYQPKDYLEFEYEGKTHRYRPDFKVGKEFWEIKGNQFVDKDGKWINPYLKDDLINEAKHQVCIENNIKILYKNEIKPYKNYFIEKYGKDFLRSLRKW